MYSGFPIKVHHNTKLVVGRLSHLVMLRFISLFIFILVISLGSCVYVDQTEVENVLIQDDQRHATQQVITMDQEPAVLNITTEYSEQTRLTLEILQRDNHTCKRSVILKSIPETPALQKTIRQLDVFQNEIEIYRYAIPLMNEVCDNLNVTMEPLFVRALGYRPYDQVLIEDAECQLNYNLGDRWCGLEKEESFLAVKALGKFHAISIVANQNNHNKISSQFNQSVLEKHSEQFGDYYEVLYKKLADVIETSWGPEWKDAVNKLRKLAPDVKNKLLTIDADVHSFPDALNIGTPSIRDTYFKYSITDLVCSTTPIAVRFSNFQRAWFNSPVSDVLYFIFTSLNVKVLDRYKTALLWRYYDALLDYLQTYGYNDSLPTEKDFKDEVHRNYLKGLTAALETLPYRFEDDKDDPLEIAEEYAQESLDTNTTVLDSSGWNSKEFSEIMQIIVDDVFRTIQLRL